MRGLAEVELALPEGYYDVWLSLSEKVSERSPPTLQLARRIRLHCIARPDDSFDPFRQRTLIKSLIDERQMDRRPSCADKGFQESVIVGGIPA